uniref:DUF5094 domain-containing protein n=1 Tax=Parastrongyloides trichosuri TaxID=131310 RepID=A0A0N5A417_PARTI
MDKIRDLKVKILLELDEACQNSVFYKKNIENELKKFVELNKKNQKRLNELKLNNNSHNLSKDELEDRYNILLRENVYINEELINLENEIENEKKILNNLKSMYRGNQKFTLNNSLKQFDHSKKNYEREVENCKIHLDKVCSKRKLTDEIIYRMVDDIKNAIAIVYHVSSYIKVVQNNSGKIFQFSKTNALKTMVLLFENVSIDKTKDSWLVFIERFIKCSFIEIPFYKNHESFFKLQIEKIKRKKKSRLLILNIIEERLKEGETKVNETMKDIKKYEDLYKEECDKLKNMIIQNIPSYDYLNKKVVLDNIEEELYIDTVKLKVQKEWISENKKYIHAISLLQSKERKLLCSKSIFLNNTFYNDALQKSYVTQAYNSFNQIKKLKKCIREMERSLVGRRNERFIIDEEINNLKVNIKKMEEKEKLHDKSLFSLSNTTIVKKGYNNKNVISEKEIEKMRKIYEEKVNLIIETRLKIKMLKNELEEIDKVIKEEELLYSKYSAQLNKLADRMSSQQQPSSTIFNYFNKLKEEKYILIKNILKLDKILSGVGEIRKNIINKTITQV